MDGDPAVEPELDAFSLILPLPYRVAIIFVAGMNIQGNAKSLTDHHYRCMGLGPEFTLFR